MKWAKGFGTYRIGKLHIVDDTQGERRALCKRDVPLSPDDYPPNMLGGVDPTQICRLCVKRAGVEVKNISDSDGDIRSKEFTASELLDVLVEHSEHHDEEPINGLTATIQIVRNSVVKVKWVS